MGQAVPDAYSSGMRGKEKPKSKGVRSIRISKAENGFTTHTEHETDGGYIPDDVHVHESMHSVVRHVKSALEGTKKLTTKEKGAD